MPSIILDNTDPAIQFVGNWTTDATSSSMLNGTYAFPNLVTSKKSQDHGLKYTFHGTALDIYGQTHDPLTVQYVLDKHTAVTNSTDQFNGALTIGTGVRWFSLSQLSDNLHTVNLTTVNGLPYFDYMVITTSNKDALKGRNIILDDSDAALQYSGKWSSQSQQIFDSGLPYLDTSRGSNAENDTVSFNFVGTSVAVFGLLNQQSGALSSTYSVDGSTPVVYTPYNGSQTAENSTWALHQQFFQADLPSGNHTLLVNVSEVTGSQMFWIDYIIYNDGFSTKSPSDAPYQGTPVISTTNAKPGIIAGAVCGGVIILALIMFVTRRRYRRDHPTRNKHVESRSGSSLPLVSSHSRVSSILDNYEVLPDSTVVLTHTPAIHRSQDASDAALPSYTRRASVPPIVPPSSDTLQIDAPEPSYSSSPPIPTPVAVSVNAPPGNTETDMERLRREVEQLRQENSRLQASSEPPPAYDDRPIA